MDQSGFKFVERFRDIKEFRYFKFRFSRRPATPRFSFTWQTFLQAVSFPGNSNFDLELRRPLLCAAESSQHLFQSISKKGILSCSSPEKLLKSATNLSSEEYGGTCIIKEVQLDGCWNDFSHRDEDSSR